MSTNPTILPAFLADLAEVHTSLQPPMLSPAFLSDLAQVHSSLPAAPIVDFGFMTDRFESWHRWAQAEMGLHLKDLSPDDPLLCPISLFRTMDSGRLETAHTHTLAWLLDPKKEHGFGDTLLATLLRWLTGRVRIDTLGAVHVVSEYPITATDGKGRLDLLADGTWKEDGQLVRWVLVIEAKVDAWESETQLATYEQWLNSERKGRKVFRVFLTPDGRLAEGGDEEWTPLSYPDLVRAFRPACTELREAPGFHFLRFYLAGVLQDICGWRSKPTDTSDPYAVLDYLKNAL